MSVYHCPLCPLIFQYRSEAEDHLRGEHRSRADEAADLRAELAAAPRPLDEKALEQLRHSTASPSVTLLLSTTPAATMTVLDIARLRQIAERARRRLLAEPQRESAPGVVEERLSRAVSAAESQPTDRGIAVLVNQDDLAIVGLPFSPRDRHVVDRGFATRDLDYALRRYPRYRILVLGHHPRILEGYAHRLSEPETYRPTGSFGAGSPVATDPDVFVSERVDAAGTLPLAVVGDHRQLDRFRRNSPHAGDVIVEILRPRLHRTNLSYLIADALEGLHEDRQSRSVAELLHADMQSQVAWGVRAAWNAIHNRTADRLWIEHDYAVPGRATDGVFGVETTSDPAEPGAIDDLVDALLAKAAQLDIKTDVLGRHALDRREPVAVQIPVPAPAHVPGGRRPLPRSAGASTALS